MNRNPTLPLTETVYYILLALLQPAHGYLIMQKVEQLSQGQVRLAAGTLYGAIENLLKQGLIHPLPTTGPRRKVYTISPLGRQVLQQDFERMQYMTQVYRQNTAGGTGNA